MPLRSWSTWGEVLFLPLLFVVLLFYSCLLEVGEHPGEVLLLFLVLLAVGQPIEEAQNHQDPYPFGRVKTENLSGITEVRHEHRIQGLTQVWKPRDGSPGG